MPRTSVGHRDQTERARLAPKDRENNVNGNPGILFGLKYRALNAQDVKHNLEDDVTSSALAQKH